MPAWALPSLRRMVVDFYSKRTGQHLKNNQVRFLDTNPCIAPKRLNRILQSVDIGPQFRKSRRQNALQEIGMVNMMEQIKVLIKQTEGQS